MVDYLSGIFGSLAPQPVAAPQLPMWNWQGRSGAWYIHTIFPLTAQTFIEGANYIMVQRLTDGTRKAIYIGQSENLRTRLPRHEKLMLAQLHGATELHIHLLATTDAERFRIETDIRNGHPAPLNEQSTPLYSGLLAALAAKP
ncbi:GIY-YIG nuclease family protein [Bradyrhizobium iriomotense]|uniref:GIY-YIG nuclease family protein n=1 Tax=Bradyrhizobium iriomotense TaxID=441950 RepID=UPI001B8A2B04|nr:GIY-YIG nuclease family protein [Bradyrhizobium iriomotense]MBR1130762.1 GIY-YIG nuclease family protein [Bradyrhizobium iriomotense]